MASPSIYLSHQMSVHHTFLTTSPSICQSIQMSDHHTNITASLSICPSHQSSDHHPANMTSLSICQTYNTSVSHTTSMTKLSTCQFHDLSVCQPKCNSTWNSVWKAVCLSSVPSVLRSAQSMVKMSMSIPVQQFPNMKYLGRIPSICTPSDWSVNPSGSPSITSSPCAETLLKIPGYNGEKHVVNYLHKIPVKSLSVHTSYSTSVTAQVCASSIQSVHTSCVMSVIAPICALSILSVCTLCITSVIAHVHASSVLSVCTLCITSVIAPVCALSNLSVLPSDDKYQEFPHEIPGTN